MATTSLWEIKGRSDHVLDYAMNPEKTENPNWSKLDVQTLRDVMDYAMDDSKTEQQYFVTALNCNAACARDQMQMTKQQFQKEDGILAWHGYQSFAAGEVDAKTAHEIGVALAKELWPDFQVIVATHLNTKCFHNHFVLNSVSYLHGGKFNGCKDSYRKMRAASDRLCKAHGLSIITEHRAYYPKHYAEWDAERKGQPTWRSAIREDVDRAIQSSMTWSQFLRALQARGYEIKTGVKHIAVRPRGKDRFVRLRSLGDAYTEDAIRDRILQQKAIERPKQENPYRGKPIRVDMDFRLSRVTWKGLRALYFFYLRKLRAAQRQPNARYDHFDHHVLVELLRKRISDEAFIGLIWKFLKAGYMEQWQYNCTYSGVPQGSGISPICANIYLSELDNYMQEYKENLPCKTRTSATSYAFCSKIRHFIKLCCKRQCRTQWMQVVAWLQMFSRLY